MRANPDLTLTAARTIAREAYVYGYPLVDNYRVQHAYFVDRQDPEYKAPYNQLAHVARLYTPADRTVQSPNADTPYSWIGLDLRAEPIVFAVPPIERGRYWSLQLVDLYTHNFAYLGTRTSGNGGGAFLVAGPQWRGAVPHGISKVLRCETEIASAQFRTQLFHPTDLENVKQIQARYLVQPLSAFLGEPAPRARPLIDFIQPLSPEAQRSSLDFFNVMSFALQFAPTHPSESDLRRRFARIGVGACNVIDTGRLAPGMRRALREGIADAWADLAAVKRTVDAGRLTSGDLFGTREHLQNNYLHRMAAVVLGLYGNSKEEAMYPAYYVDAAGRKLSGAHCYTLRFEPDRLPPVDAFWSLTMYEQPSNLLVANPIHRYRLDSTMDDRFRRDGDGGVTLLLQHESPGQDLEVNWLPAPQGPFSALLRLYLPKPEALDGRWTAPALHRVPDPTASAPDGA